MGAMTAAQLLDRAIADGGANLHGLTLLLRVHSEAYAEAARQRKDGNRNANPITMALLEQGGFTIMCYTNKQITIRNCSTGQQYSGLMPPTLAEYLEAFRRGVPNLEDHEFELTLVSDE
jgi:hypothetical protein